MKIFLIIILLAATANAQLRAYTFNYTDEFGTDENCYLTLKSIVADWDSNTLNVGFNCYESKTIRERGTPPKRTFPMELKGTDFVNNVLVPITSAEAGGLRAIALSEWSWSIAETYKFIPTYTYNSTSKTMVETKKSLNDLSAVRVDVPLQ